MGEIKTAGELNKKYLREGMWPTIFCNGCGNGVVLEYTFWALEELGLDMDKVAFASGIGCSSRLPGYINADGLHTTHGRAIAFATGLKAANPDLTVIIFTGDGDCAGIGGNHFIHLCRRNLDCIVLLFNNSIYAMTGGQGAPTTLYGAKSTTTPYKMFENRSDGVKLAIAAGATYVARTTVAHPRTFIKYFKKALKHKGTSVIEIVTPCVTYFGRKNLDSLGAEYLGVKGEKMDTGGKMIDWIKRNTVRINQAKFMSEEELFNKYVIGEFKYDPSKPEYSEEYAKIQKIAMEGK